MGGDILGETEGVLCSRGVAAMEVILHQIKLLRGLSGSESFHVDDVAVLSLGGVGRRDHESKPLLPARRVSWGVGVLRHVTKDRAFSEWFRAAKEWNQSRVHVALDMFQ